MKCTAMTLHCGWRVAVLGLALAAGGCGYSLPFLARPGAPAAQGTTVAPPASAPAATAHTRASHAARSKRTGASHANARHAAPAHEAALRVTTPREQIDDARVHAISSPAEPYWPYRAAELYLALSAPDSALDALRGALARDARYAPALALFSKLEYDAGRHDDAIAVLESARMAARRTSSELAPELLAGLALHYAAVGRAAEANEALAAVPHAAHKTADATAAAMAVRGDSDSSAARLAETALDENPRSAACQNNVGIARLRVGDVEGARKALLAAIDLDAQRPGPYYNLTILEKYYALDDAAAARWFAKYRALSSEDPDGLGAVLAITEAKDLAEGSKP